MLDTAVAATAKEGNASAATKVMTTLALERPSKKHVSSAAPLTHVMTATMLDTQLEDSNNSRLQHVDVNFGDTFVGVYDALTDEETATSLALEEMVHGQR